jgi:hypothetical protein
MQWGRTECGAVNSFQHARFVIGAGIILEEALAAPYAMAARLFACCNSP